MKRLRFKYLLVLSALFITCSTTENGPVGPVSATTLFSDNFSADVAGNWVVLGGAGVTKTVSGGACQVRNDSNSTAVLLHSDNFANFTFSVDLTVADTSFSNVGLFFGVTDQNGGYVFSISSSQYYMLSKIPNGGGAVAPIHTFPNSFITSGTNTLKVSKHGSEIKCYINGKFVKRVVDGDFAGGSAGFIIPPYTTVTFDNALVTNEDPAMDSVTLFKDVFSDGNLNGWYTQNVEGTAACSTGFVHLETPAAAGSPSILFTSGAYATAGYGRVVVQRKAGSSTGYYGFALVKACSTDVSGFSFKTAFFIVRDNSYFAIIPDSGSYSLYVNSNIRSGLNKDTLEFRKNGAGVYTFSVNGDSVGVYTNPKQIEFNGAGIVAARNLTVDFSDFVIASDSLASTVGVIARAPSTRKYMVAGFSPMGGELFDLLGRKVGSYSASGAAALNNSRFVIRKSLDAQAAVREILVK